MSDNQLAKETEKITEKLANGGLDEFVRYLRNPWHIIWTNLLAGIFRGLGFVLGATVVLTVVVFILVKILGGIPVVGDWFQTVGGFFQDVQRASQLIGR